MRGSELSEDLAFARRLAEEGAGAPSLSGRFAVWWGSLVFLALVFEWAVESGRLDVHPAVIGLVWLGVCVIGNAGAFVLARGMGDKPGQGSALNRALNGIWPIAGFGLFLYAAAITVAVIGRGQPTELFATIMPVAFLVYAAVEAASAALTRRPSLRGMAGLSLVFAAATAAMIGLPEMYLVAALGVVLTQIVPGVMALRAEPAPVVAK